MRVPRLGCWRRGRERGGWNGDRDGIGMGYEMGM